ncbi:MAG: ABC transporter permease [Clostridioides sp.]|jgi:hypothetical protein|nr:ABC transporter permease [Clostridioides sp.]
MELKNFIKNKSVRFAILMALFYQIAMLGIYMYGYKAIPQNIEQLRVVLVNNDGAYSEQVVDGFQKSLPFKVEISKDMKKSEAKLQEREVAMIVEVPKDFSKSVSTGKEVSLNYHINKSNAQTTGSVMNEVASNITRQMNEKMNPGFKTHVSSNIIESNKIPGVMSYQMAPMFLTLANYTGAMVASLTLAMVFKTQSKKIGAYKVFMKVEIVGVIISVVAPILGAIMVKCFLGIDGSRFIHIYLQGILSLFTALQFTLIFSLILGQSGTFANIPILLCQTLASGAIMGIEMMPNFFKFIAKSTVIYPNTQMLYNILYGGGNSGSYERQLVCVMLVSLAIDFIIVYYHKRKEDKLLEAGAN